MFFLLCSWQQDKNGWYRTVVYFQDATVNLESNGNKLFKITDIFGKHTFSRLFCFVCLFPFNYRRYRLPTWATPPEDG